MRKKTSKGKNLRKIEKSKDLISRTSDISKAFKIRLFKDEIKLKKKDNIFEQTFSTEKSIKLNIDYSLLNKKIKIKI